MQIALIIGMAAATIVFLVAEAIDKIEELRSSKDPGKMLRKEIFRVGKKLLALAAVGGIIGLLMELQK